MKTTGILKQIDELNRVVIPKKLTKSMGIEVRDYLEVFVEGDKIILSKYQPGCIFCSATEHTHEHKGKIVCEDCIAALSRK